MRELGSFEEAHGRVLAGAQRLVAGVQRVVAEPVDSVADGIALLASLRKLAHDQLMVLQREHMIIAAAQWLVKNGLADPATRWQWSPRPGSETPLDLIGRAGERVVASAQVAAAEEPGGMVDAQMRRALARLAASDGRRHYFVRTATMKRRAATRVAKEGWDIAVVQLAAPLTTMAGERAALLSGAAFAVRSD